MFREERLGILEGLLFAVGDEGLTLMQASYVLEVDELEVQSLLIDLKARYEAKSAGLAIIEVGDVHKLTTKKDHAAYLKRLIQNPNQRGLSNAALEVLAIIAYRQPITRHEIEQIRGSSSENVIRRMLTFSLIEEGGRLDAPGRPILFKTTDDFLDYFGIKTLEELPTLKAIEATFNLDEEADLFNFETELGADE